MTDSAPAAPEAAAPDRLALAAPDDAQTEEGRAAWEAATAAVLRKSGRLAEGDPDARVWELLTRTTLDGIAVAPLGTPAQVADLPVPAAPGTAPYTRGRLAERPEEGWDVRAQVSGLTAVEANEVALVDLENGATSLWLEVGPGGVPAGDLERALQGVFLDLAPVVLDAPGDQLGAARALADLLRDAAVEPHPGTNLGVDPVGDALRAAPDADRVAAPSLTDAVEAARLARGAGTLALVVDGTALHDRGASDAQELGYVLALGAAYLRVLTAPEAEGGAGLGVDEALGLLEFRLAATDEQFPTIAKFRAARRTWARVAELSGASPEASAMRQHAVTSRPMTSRYDAWVNMLRGTVAAFAAGVGGADALTVVPFDEPLGVPEALGRRNARNTSSLLIHESHVAKVADPAGGSYAVEKLTDDLARAAWAELSAVEEAGDVVAALADGSLLSRVAGVVAARDAQVARRKRPITGLTEFPNADETVPQRRPHPAARPVRPYGAAFEAMRDEPAAQRAFLATLGTVAQHTARATFASNLLAAGGIAVDAAGPTSSVDDVVAAYSGQPVVVLAGTDKAYAEQGADVVAALRAAGARHVVLAGKPGESTVAADLVDDSCALGVDALAFLTRTREALA